MTAYVISEVEIRDESVAEEYRNLAAASIAEHGGRYLVRGATPDSLEGEWPSGKRLVVVEFPDADAVRRWYSSPSYAKALVFRDRALTRRLILAEGVTIG
jgi:uncharacterized protein (DUF1330 family)